MTRAVLYLFSLFLVLSLAFFAIGLLKGFASAYLLFIRPITAFQFSTLLAFILGLLAFRKRVERGLTAEKKEVYIGLGFLFAMASFYQLLVNFSVWTSLTTMSGGLGQLNDFRIVTSANPALHPFISSLNATLVASSGLYPPNPIIATELWCLMFFASVYWVYFASRLGAERPE